MLNLQTKYFDTMARTFVIGDMHGALRAVKQVVERIQLQSDDTLIFLGDYVDGWSESAQLIEYLMRLALEVKCIFIKGNHDAWCESWMQGETPDPVWLANGGQETVNSYEHISPEQKLLHLEFFNRMRLYYTDEDQRLFVHAGFTSMSGPVRERFEIMLYWDRTLWEMALAVDKQIKFDQRIYPKRLLLFKEIFIGHTPTTNYDVDIPMNACNVWNVDTGAAFKGKVSALEIHSKEFVQSDPAYLLYPGEVGRNRLP
jgi:serine/threonine protein phosphatase 1